MYSFLISYQHTNTCATINCDHVTFIADALKGAWNIGTIGDTAVVIPKVQVTLASSVVQTTFIDVYSGRMNDYSRHSFGRNLEGASACRAGANFDGG